MRFHPEEVLFSPTTKCNLGCLPCTIERSRATLPPRTAVRFLRECKRFGIKTVGFTGGEPFLAMGFLMALVKEAVKEDMLFDRIMTNGAWTSDKKTLVKALGALRDAGYDGSICVSVDAFHRQNLKKVALFIRTAAELWGRPDVVSLAYIGGAREGETKEKLTRLSALLKARLMGFGTHRQAIRSGELFIALMTIALSPIGKASAIKDPWDGTWFKEDRCKGPGNVFFVMPDGNVKPCCGYANGLKELTIGTIKRDSMKDIMKNARENRFVSTVFRSGLAEVRRRLGRLGVRFPGKASNHCFFCRYVLTEVPREILERCLD